MGTYLLPSIATNERGDQVFVAYSRNEADNPDKSPNILCKNADGTQQKDALTIVAYRNLVKSTNKYPLIQNPSGYASKCLLPNNLPDGNGQDGNRYDKVVLAVNSDHLYVLSLEHDKNYNQEYLTLRSGTIPANINDPITDWKEVAPPLLIGENNGAHTDQYSNLAIVFDDKLEPYVAYTDIRNDLSWEVTLLTVTMGSNKWKTIKVDSPVYNGTKLILKYNLGRVFLVYEKPKNGCGLPVVMAYNENNPIDPKTGIIQMENLSDLGHIDLNTCTGYQNPFYFSFDVDKRQNKLYFLAVYNGSKQMQLFRGYWDKNVVDPQQEDNFTWKNDNRVYLNFSKEVSDLRLFALNGNIFGISVISPTSNGGSGTRDFNYFTITKNKTYVGSYKAFFGSSNNATLLEHPYVVSGNPTQWPFTNSQVYVLEPDGNSEGRIRYHLDAADLIK